MPAMSQDSQATAYLSPDLNEHLPIASRDWEVCQAITGDLDSVGGDCFAKR